MLSLVVFVLQVYVFILIAYSVMSWVRPSFDSPVRKVQRGLAAVCDPILNPVRRLMPTAQVGGVGLDLSVIVVILVIEVIALPLLAR
jgi:YggT family protein